AMVVSALPRPRRPHWRHHSPCHDRCHSCQYTPRAAMARMTYRGAGVDIDAGDALVERIKPLARATARPGVLGGIGGFGALFDLRAAGFRDPVLVSSTDGVGTK